MKSPREILAKRAARKIRRAEKVAENKAPVDAYASSQEADGTPRIPPAPIADCKPRKRRKKSPTLSKLKKDLWREISLLVRSWSECCLTCGGAVESANHIIPSHEGAITRFFLPNLYPGCSGCNSYEKNYRSRWATTIFPQKFGPDYVEALALMSRETFQLKKHWVVEQIERMKALRARQN